MNKSNEATSKYQDISVREFAYKLTDKLIDTSATFLNEISDEFLIKTIRYLEEETGGFRRFSASEYLLAELNRRKPNLFKLYGYSNISKELFLELYEKVKGDIVLEHELLYRHDEI